MKRTEVKFLYCKHCGNLVGVIEDSGVDIICCGEPMEQLVPKTSDQGVEKHLPKVEKTENGIKVTVGEVLHPMTEEHHISWIAVVKDCCTTRKTLAPTGEPTAEFDVDSNADVYSYCNLHGLWKVTI